MSIPPSLLDAIRRPTDREEHLLALVAHFRDNGRDVLAAVFRQHCPAVRDCMEPPWRLSVEQAVERSRSMKRRDLARLAASPGSSGWLGEWRWPRSVVRRDRQQHALGLRAANLSRSPRMSDTAVSNLVRHRRFPLDTAVGGASSAATRPPSPRLGSVLSDPGGHLYHVLDCQLRVVFGHLDRSMAKQGLSSLKSENSPRPRPRPCAGVGKATSAGCHGRDTCARWPGRSCPA